MASVIRFQGYLETRVKSSRLCLLVLTSQVGRVKNIEVESRASKKEATFVSDRISATKNSWKRPADVRVATLEMQEV